ncbi:hypothetical protein IG631_21328 [Alternaria alternata]|nr:hypothetical protein IG631_21328 [Alternaria alternata]
MSRSPLLLRSQSSDPGSPPTPVQHHQNALSYDAILHRYMLSYSASCPCLIRPLVQLFEKTLLPTWVSHYAISIRDKLPGVGGLEIDQVERNYPSDDDLDDERPLLEHRDGLQFQLFRQGSLPFASIAYFETCQPRQDPRVRRDEKIVTATVKPEDVVQHSMYEQRTS